MDGSFWDPLRGPNCGRKTAHPAVLGVGRICPCIPTRRGICVGPADELLCAALDRRSAPPYALVVDCGFRAAPARLRWTSPIHPPTRSFSTGVFGSRLRDPVGRAFRTPLRGSCPCYKKWGALAACAGRVRVTPPRTRPWVRLPNPLMRCAGRGRATPLRGSCLRYEK